jgi:hypothetical protein
MGLLRRLCLMIHRRHHEKQYLWMKIWRFMLR